MVLANRAKLQNSRSLVRVFGGLNETYACSEAEYSAGVNFFCPGFPGAEHPQAAPQAEGVDRAERHVSPERAADRLREGSDLHAGCRRREPGDLHRGSDRRQKGTGGHWYKNPDLPGQGSL